ncbi:hypothetical protein Hamer_G019106 [Homarus americanus]|uniref:Uncharacterized protein n=1 Tax=Homarus americanus TaxID=6706 RepID=A0A8J5MUJ0_HOMAM|nr:hypothetical protein Hamer_G019106 [Homarus americanus]
MVNISLSLITASQEYTQDKDFCSFHHFINRSQVFTGDEGEPVRGDSKWWSDKMHCWATGSCVSHIRPSVQGVNYWTDGIFYTYICTRKSINYVL